MKKLVFIAALAWLLAACADAGQPRTKAAAGLNVLSAVTLDGGRSLALLSASHEVLVVGAFDLAIQRRYSLPNYSYSVVRCHGSLCAIAGGSHDSGKLLVLDLSTGKIHEPSADIEFAEVYDIAFLPSDAIATAHADESIAVWDTKSLALTNRMVAAGGLEVFALSQAAEYVLSGDSRGQVIEWDPRTGKDVRKYLWDGHSVFTIVPFGDAILAGGPGGIVLLDTKSFQPKAKAAMPTVAVLNCGLGDSLARAFCGLSDGRYIEVFADGRTSFLKLRQSRPPQSIRIDGDKALEISKSGRIRLVDLSHP